MGCPPDEAGSGRNAPSVRAGAANRKSIGIAARRARGGLLLYKQAASLPLRGARTLNAGASGGNADGLFFLKSSACRPSVNSGYKRFLLPGDEVERCGACHPPEH